MLGTIARRLPSSKLGACRTCMTLTALMFAGSAAALAPAAHLGGAAAFVGAAAFAFSTVFAAAHSAMLAYRRIHRRTRPVSVGAERPCGCGGEVPAPGRAPSRAGMIVPAGTRRRPQPSKVR